MQYHELTLYNMESVIPLYIEHYNTYEGGEWTRDTTYKRIHQVVTREDSFGLVLEDEGEVLGFGMGYLEQYDDGVAYDLVEIVILHERQGQGLGMALLEELECGAKARGAFLIQLQAVNDEAHDRFYHKAGFGDAANFTLKCKMI